ncbi:MAG: hypothetical protein JOZ18_14030 [Chloroflexi bacterium]|nr:hypothetical protein [Chloroflexota bacterium]
MTIFNQNGQNVNNQYNVGRDIHVRDQHRVGGDVVYGTQTKFEGDNYGNQAGRDINIGAGQHTGDDPIATLKHLQSLLAQAQERGLLDEETSTEAVYHVSKAFQQAKKPNPDKNSILDNLNTAKEFVEGVAAAGGLVTAIANAIELVRRMF